jgi:hypothetical protein
MSTGLVICSACKREVHQRVGYRDANGVEQVVYETAVYPRRIWVHCEDRSLMCPGASAIYPNSKDEIVGKYCGEDDIGGI